MLKALILVASIVAIGYGLRQPAPEPEKPVLKVGAHEFDVDVSDDPFERVLGLSGRESLAENEGMLFVFKKAALHGFWMKDMNFSLDFVWIRDGKVVELDENIPHPAANNGEIYRVKQSEHADWVLEINAGLVEKLGIQVGDEVSLEE